MYTYIFIHICMCCAEHVVIYYTNIFNIRPEAGVSSGAPSQAFRGGQVRWHQEVDVKPSEIHMFGDHFLKI